MSSELRVVAAAIIALDGRVFSSRLEYTGTLSVRCEDGAYVYATPDWDGPDELLIEVLSNEQSSTADVRSVVRVCWSRDVEYDRATWSALVEPYVRDHMLKKTETEQPRETEDVLL